MTNAGFYGILNRLFRVGLTLGGSIFRQINWVDVFVLILLIRSTYVGLKRGFLNEIFKIFGVIVTLFVAIHYYANIAQFLTTQAFFSKLSLPFNEGLSFICLSVSVLLIFKLGGIIARFGIHLEANGPLERMGGLVCGFIRGGILAGLVLFALNLFPFDYLKKSINENSLSGFRVIKVGPTVHDTIIRISPRPSEKNT